MATISQHDSLVEYGDRWLVPLQGKKVTRCFVDSAFGLELWESDNTTTIRIEGPFTVQEHGVAQRLSPEQPKTLGSALSLLGKTVATVNVYKDGCLTMNFADGSDLSVPPNAAYEAWEVVSSRGLRVVSTPGGTLSIWQAARESDRP
jgi:hypothetical protein